MSRPAQLPKSRNPGAGRQRFVSGEPLHHGVEEEAHPKRESRRDNVLISTKATFRSGEGPNDVGSSRFHLISSVEGALNRLGTDYIDLFQLHDFDAQTPN
jgi:diketogulonate reductase-like aldo/keto reductase